jgi:chemotaxis protein methyltransferase CheR
MLPVRNPTLQMADGEFRRFAALLRSHCGLHFTPDTRFLLEKRIARRMGELELRSFAAYHYRIRAASPGDGEFANLIDELTTNETYFFRERNQLRALVSEILPELRGERVEREGQPMRIWSAGCSSGEEPYSIVMLAREVGFVPGVDLHVYASDISRRMLRKARQGLYREASFRETETHLRERYFTEKEGFWRISDDIKKHVDFIHLNLLDESKLALLGSMDVILCRNVIIYFDMETKRRVIGTLVDKLRPGGHMLLGHSESLINLSNAMELRSLRNDLVYRRPSEGVPPRDPWHAIAAQAARAADRDGEGR